MKQFKALIEYVGRRMALQQARTAFHSMDGSMLHDIGLERCQIDDLVRGGAA